MKKFPEGSQALGEFSKQKHNVRGTNDGEKLEGKGAQCPIPQNLRLYMKNLW